MPDTLRTTAAANADQRLSQLIKLKQLEKPDAAYWQRFEQEFRSRQLSTFVRVQPLRIRLWRACRIVARKAAPPVAATGAVAITFFAVNSTSNLVDSNANETELQKQLAAQTEEAREPDSFFLVQTELEQTEAANTISADGTIYQINVLSSGYTTSSGYQLNATPVTFSQGSQPQSIGAQVISAQPNY